LTERQKHFEQRLHDDGLLRNGSKFISIKSDAQVIIFSTARLFNGKLNSLVQRSSVVDAVISQVEELETDYLVIYPSIAVTPEDIKPSCLEFINRLRCNIVVCHH
jgi:hypothetical protein